MVMKTFSILISGRGSNMEALLRAEKQGALYARCALVVSDKSDARGLEVARSYSIPTEVIPWKDSDAAELRCLDMLRRAGADFIVLAGFMRILKKTLIDTYRNKIINIHPSLLPSFPGLRAQKQALDSGVRVTGCTTHFVNDGVDAGPIILQKTVPVLEGDDEDTLSNRILPFEHELLVESVNLFAADCLEIVEGRHVRIDIEKFRQFRIGLNQHD